MLITIPSFVNIVSYITAPSSLSSREEESHKIRTGLFVGNYLPPTSTKILFCGRGLKFFPPLKHQF